MPGRVTYQDSETNIPVGSAPGDVDPEYSFYTDYEPVPINSSDGGFYGDLKTVSYVDTDAAGNLVTKTLTGVDNEQFTEWYPGFGATYPCDFYFEFNADTPDAVANPPTPADAGDYWLLESDDPVKAVVTPELPSGALMLIGLAPLGLAWLRRKKED